MKDNSKPFDSSIFPSPRACNVCHDIIEFGIHSHEKFVHYGMSGDGEMFQSKSEKEVREWLSSPKAVQDE